MPNNKVNAAKQTRVKGALREDGQGARSSSAMSMVSAFNDLFPPKQNLTIVPAHCEVSGRSTAPCAGFVRWEKGQR